MQWDYYIPYVELTCLNFAGVFIIRFHCIAKRKVKRKLPYFGVRVVSRFFNLLR